MCHVGQHFDSGYLFSRSGGPYIQDVSCDLRRFKQTCSLVTALALGRPHLVTALNGLSADEHLQTWLGRAWRTRRSASQLRAILEAYAPAAPSKASSPRSPAGDHPRSGLRQSSTSCSSTLSSGDQDSALSLPSKAPCCPPARSVDSHQLPICPVIHLLTHSGSAFHALALTQIK